MAEAHEEGVKAVAALGAPVTSVGNWLARGIGGVRPTPSPADPSPAPEAAAPSSPAPEAPVARTAAAARFARSKARARVAKIYNPTQVAQALERVAAIGVRPAAKELGISRNALRLGLVDPASNVKNAIARYPHNAVLVVSWSSTSRDHTRASPMPRCCIASILMLVVNVLALPPRKRYL